MARYEADDYEFPDEAGGDVELDIDEIDGIEIEIEDDTPVADRNARPPLPKDIVDELETADESDEYSGKVKVKFKQYKKAWNDERRLKEEAYREQEEALAVAQKILDENKHLKSLLESGEKELISTYQSSAELEMEKAKRNYKEAYDYGNTDAIIEAQEELMKATNKLDKAQNFRPTAQNADTGAQLLQKQQRAVQQDPKAAEWVAENPWYVDPTKKVMSRFAVGIHEDLVDTYGDKFVGSDEYYKRIDQEVQRRFPEEFSDQNDEPKAQRTSKLSTVVASAKRSTAPKKVSLSKTQVALAKKFGLTNEQYARELTKLEA
jgi:hypothetical protein